MAIATGTAILGAAALSAGASAMAASKGSKAQKQAAQMQQQTEANNLALQERIFEQQRTDQAPWREAGATRLGDLMGQTGQGGDLNRDFTMADFEADPGYEFRQNEGMKRIQASAAARGTLNSGSTLKSLLKYGQGVASDEYGRSYDRFNNNRTTRFNRLASIAGVGQTATNALGQAGQNFGAQASSAYGRMGEAQANVGNARASSYAGMAQGVNNLASGVGNYYTMRQFMPQTAGASAFNPAYAMNASTGAVDSYNAANQFRPFGG